MKGLSESRQFSYNAWPEAELFGHLSPENTEQG